MMLVPLLLWLSVGTYCTGRRATEVEGIQEKISEVLLDDDVNSFCLKSEVSKVGVCVYIHDVKLTWEEARRTCTSLGGYLPKDNRGHLDDYRRQMLEETYVAFLTSEMRFPDGMWLGYCMPPTEGQTMKFPNWREGQPKCSPMGCLKWGMYDGWSTVDCKLRSNFMCIKVSSSCEDSSCVVIPYPDTSKELNPQYQQPTNSPQISQQVVLYVLGGLVAVVLLITIILIVVCCKIKKYRKKAREINQALHRANHYQTLARNRSRYENDAYTELSPDSPSNPREVGNVYTTVGDGIYPPSMDTKDIQSNLKFSPRKGSLPARPDVVPLSLHQSPTDPPSEDYLEVFPVPYADLRQMKHQGDIRKDDQKLNNDLTNRDCKREEEEGNITCQ